MDQIVLGERQCKENNGFKIPKYIVFPWLKVVLPNTLEYQKPSPHLDVCLPWPLIW